MWLTYVVGEGESILILALAGLPVAAVPGGEEGDLSGASIVSILPS